MCSDLRFTNVVAAFISELIPKMKKFEEEGEEGSEEEGEGSEEEGEGSEEEGELQEDAGD